MFTYCLTMRCSRSTRYAPGAPPSASDMSLRSVISIFCAIIVCLSPALAADKPDYQGIWRYHVEKSREALRSNERVPQKVKDAFLKTGMPYTENVAFAFKEKSVAILHGREDPAEAEFYGFEIIDWTPDYFTYRASWFDEPPRGNITNYFEGNCYYNLEGEMMLKSYFCNEK